MEETKLWRIWKQFVINIHKGQNLPSRKARQNLEKGIVEIVWKNGGHNSNGLLLTSDGYIITCFHCAGKDRDKKLVKYGEKLYKINKLCAADPKHDLAIIKIGLKQKTKGQEYKFSLKPLILHEKIPIVQLGLFDGRLIRRSGHIREKTAMVKSKKTSDLIYDQLILNIKARAGDSGSVIASTDGSIIGICTAGDNDTIASGTLIYYALSLIMEFCSS